jgi:hypothetical protein
MDMDYLIVRIIRKKIEETREGKLGSGNFIQFKSLEFTECNNLASARMKGECKQGNLQHGVRPDWRKTASPVRC